MRKADQILADALRLAIPDVEVFSGHPDGLFVMVLGWPQEDEARAIVAAVKRVLAAVEPSIAEVPVSVGSK